MYQNAAILAAFLLIYSAVAGRVERSWLSGPIVFTAAGLLLGPYGLGVVRLKPAGEGDGRAFIRKVAAVKRS